MTSKLDKCLEKRDLSSQSLIWTEEGIYIQSSLPSSSTLPPHAISKLLRYGHSAQGTSLNNPVFISDSLRDTSRHPSHPGSSVSWFNMDEGLSTQESFSSSSYFDTIYRSRMPIKMAPLSSTITANRHVTIVICRWPDKSRTACLADHTQTHSKN